MPNVKRCLRLLLLLTLGYFATHLPNQVAGQERTHFDSGFDIDQGIRFESTSPNGLHQAISPNGQMRAITEFGKVIIESVADETQLFEFETSGGTHTPTFTPDSQQLIAAVSRGNLGSIDTLYAWSLTTGERVRIGECSGYVIDICCDQQDKRLAVSTYYGLIFSLVLASRNDDRWYGGEIVVFDREREDESLRIFCELTDVAMPQPDSEMASPTSLSEELNRQLDDANRRCLPIRLAFTDDGRYLVGITSTGVVHILDPESGQSNLVLSAEGRVGTEQLTRKDE